MKKVLRKKVLPAFLAFCLCLVMLPTTAYAEDKHILMDAADGFTLSASQNNNCSINVANSNGGGDTIAFKDLDGNDISNISITVSNGEADITLPENTEFKLAFHYDFMSVKYNGAAITADTVLNSDSTFSLRVEPLQQDPNPGGGNPNPGGGNGQERHFVISAENGISLSTEDNMSVKVKIGDGADYIHFVDMDGQSIPSNNMSVRVADNQADIAMLENTSFKLDFHYDFMNVRQNDNATVNENTVFNSSDNFNLRVEAINSGSSDPGQNDPGQEPPSNDSTFKRLDLQFYWVTETGESKSMVLDGIIDVADDGPAFAVPADFPFDKDKFVVEVLALQTVSVSGDVISGKVYADDEPNNFRSGLMIDDQNRDAFEIRYHRNPDGSDARDDNKMQFGIEFHANDAGNIYGYPGFYIVKLTFVKEGYVGVTVDQDKVPDYYDFATSNKVDLSATSRENPGQLNTYYGNESIRVISDMPEYEITGIETYDLPTGAVTVNVSDGTVKVNSPYFDTIPLKVTATNANSGESVTGYVIVNVTGIEAGFWGKGNDHFIHGASGAGVKFPAENQNKHNWTTVFYQDVDVPDNTYEMVALLTYEDGSTETVQVASCGSGVGNKDKRLKGCDYILWSGDNEEDAPVKVSVTAVKAGSLTGSTFNGCSFGSGAGVTVEK